MNTLGMAATCSQVIKNNTHIFESLKMYVNADCNKKKSCISLQIAFTQSI